MKVPYGSEMGGGGMAGGDLLKIKTYGHT
jgi:hypothetical protein